MDMNRRRFVTTLGSSLAVPRLLLPGQPAARAYGSGSFGEWIEDEFGLPAFRYTCDQVHDPKAVTAVKPGILSPTDHIHQVGNDRLVAVVSNYGIVQVRQDEGAPKFLADYAPDHGHYGGGIGYFSYSGNMDTAITIRTALVKGDQIYIQAAAGVVADSDPSYEYRETNAKLGGVAKAVEWAEDGLD